MDDITLLRAIPSTEECTFRELCSALGEDKPERGDKPAWGKLFGQLRRFEREGLIEIDWNNNEINTMVLSESGASRVRVSK